VCTCSWTVLVLWYVQMDRLSLVVTSEIKYTEQYCYNKERTPTFCQFKDNNLARVYNCMEKVHVYQTDQL